eukprot:2037111-Rhodomonas_salina.3
MCVKVTPPIILRCVPYHPTLCPLSSYAMSPILLRCASYHPMPFTLSSYAVCYVLATPYPLPSYAMSTILLFYVPIILRYVLRPSYDKCVTCLNLPTQCATQCPVLT